MRKYTLRELRGFVRLGIAVDASIELPENWRELDKIGYSTGIYGISGGLLEDPRTGEKFVILNRSSNLYRIF